MGLRVLHLAFEDFRRPGSGGGSLRSHQVNCRLAASGVQVTVVVSSWPGCQDRVEDGVRYVHVGLSAGGRAVNLVSYFAALPLAVHRLQGEADLVVEDFAAPIGSAFVPAYTRKPTLAVVQWLDAAAKSKQYHLPLRPIEDAGVRRHSTFIAMSPDLADELRVRNPGARVEVVPNGVERAAFEVEQPRGDDVVFLGRLEIAQKGLDLLVQAVAGVADRLPGRVLVAGDGPDEAKMRRLVELAGLGERVQLLGRCSGPDKLALLARGAVVAMPSRYETFGLVALEAMACGTPVVAFSIPSLRDLVDDTVGRTVAAGDVEAFGAALVELATSRATADALGRAGRERARAYDWDDIASQQQRIYQEVASGG